MDQGFHQASEHVVAPEGAVMVSVLPVPGATLTESMS